MKDLFKNSVDIEEVAMENRNLNSFRTGMEQFRGFEQNECILTIVGLEDEKTGIHRAAYCLANSYGTIINAFYYTDNGFDAYCGQGALIMSLYQGLLAAYVNGSIKVKINYEEFESLENILSGKNIGTIAETEVLKVLSNAMPFMQLGYEKATEEDKKYFEFKKMLTM